MLTGASKSSQRRFPESHRAILVFGVNGQAICPEIGIEVRLNGDQLGGRGLGGVKKVHCCTAVFGVRHQFTVFFHFFPGGTFHCHRINPHDRAGVVLVSVNGGLLEVAGKVSDTWLRCRIVNDIAQKSGQQQNEYEFFIFQFLKIVGIPVKLRQVARIYQLSTATAEISGVASRFPMHIPTIFIALIN